MGPAVPGGSGCDWGAFDLDGGVTSSTVQYNYAHDNAGPGLLAYINGTWSGNTFRNNICENNGYGLAISGDGAMTDDLVIHNNTLFNQTTKFPLVQIAITTGGMVEGTIANNIFDAAGDAQVLAIPAWNKADVSELAFRQNDYWATKTPVFSVGSKPYTGLAAWATATGQEMQAGVMIGLQVDPQLTSPGGGKNLGGYNPDALAGYLLLPASSLRGQGLDLAANFMINPGPTDFFGHAIPHKTGTGYNLGADGSP
jgi:hypothetical protein